MAGQGLKPEKADKCSKGLLRLTSVYLLICFYFKKVGCVVVDEIPSLGLGHLFQLGGRSANGNLQTNICEAVC